MNRDDYGSAADLESLRGQYQNRRPRTLFAGVVLIIVALLLAGLACCSGNVIEVRGVFTTGDEFLFCLDYNPDAIDSEPDDLSEGDYYTWTGRVTLDYAGNHIETSGSSVYVYRNHQGLSGIAAYNEHGFEWNGLSFGEGGMYFAAASPFIHQYFPSDSLSLVADLAGNPVWESPFVDPYFEFNDLNNLLHLETDRPNPTFTAVPEIEPTMLFAWGCLFVLGATRRLRL